MLSTSWALAEQLLRLVANLIVGVYVARYLGPDQFGIYSYVLALVALFSAIPRLGMDGVQVRNIVQYPEKKQLYLGTALHLKLIATILVLIVLIVLIQITESDPLVKLYVAIVASGLIFQSWDVIEYYFQAKAIAKFSSIAKLIQLTVSSLLKIYLVSIDASLIWFVWVTLFDQALLAITLAIAYWRCNRTLFVNSFDRNIALQTLKLSWPILISGIAINLYMRIDQVMLKKMISTEAVGLYSAATRLSEAWYFVPVIITSSLFPAILNSKKENQDLFENRLRQLYQLMLILGFAIAIFTTFTSSYLIDLLYGEAYKDAAIVLTIHIWTGLFVAIGVVNNAWYLTENLQKIAMINTLLGAIANVVLNYILIPRYGVSGAAAATLISYAFSTYFSLAINKATRQQFYRINYSLITFYKFNLSINQIK
jgi:O-antigen/teichoic acid export membrane protein